MMQALQGLPRLAFLGFFSSHIAATLLIDVQAIAPAAWVPSPLARVLDWYASGLQDPLMSNPVPWFQSLICLEMVFQLPFFVWAVSELSSHKGRLRVCVVGVESPMLLEPPFSHSFLCALLANYSDNFRCACIAYGAHTSTTMAPILTAIATNATNTMTQKWCLAAIYLPYLFFPFAIMCLAVWGSASTAIKKQS